MASNSQHPLTPLPPPSQVGFSVYSVQSPLTITYGIYLVHVQLRPDAVHCNVVIQPKPQALYDCCVVRHLS